MTGKKTTKSIYKEISLSLIDRPEEIVRMEVDQDELAELAKSISERGLLQAIGVKPKGDRFMIVFGDRRYMAHEMLGRKKIMCRIEDIDDNQVVIDRAMENVQRVNLTPFEEGHIYRGLIEKVGMNLDEISKRVGKTPGTIQRRMDILRMPESFQRALHKGLINIAVAEELWHCPDKAKREYFVELAIEHGITRVVAHQWVMDYKKAKREGKKDIIEGGGDLPPYVEEPLYKACDLCQGPEQYKDLIFLRICKKCGETLQQAILKRT